MINVEGLTSQLYTRQFRNLMFTVYNIIDDEGFVAEANGMDKENYGIDDFKYMRFSLTDEDKMALKKRKSNIMNVINDFKYEIEKVKQPNFARCRIYALPDLGSVIAVKLNNFNLNDLK